ncbi:MAG: glycosyltransferase, partial [Verrucomicrobiae bacterium]|nr:glycosyltransferase [Verrucomicrobiae bacterium]
IITATYNASNCIKNLIDSLKRQTDQDFEWVVADGGSTDGTLELLQDNKNIFNLIIDSRPDFGIYDAINRAIKISNSNYYVVIGADDEFYNDAIYNYKIACKNSDADFITSRVEVDGKICSVKKKMEWMYGQFAHVSAHAVGLAVKKKLHDKFGYYSRYFPIAADQLFILKSIHGCATINHQHFISGKFNRMGISSQDVLGTLVEGFRVQVKVGHLLLPQLALLVARIIKNRSKITRNLF